jgi:hypothetical protein
VIPTVLMEAVALNMGKSFAFLPFLQLLSLHI